MFTVFCIDFGLFFIVAHQVTIEEFVLLWSNKNKFLRVGFHLKADEYIMWSALFIWLYFLFISSTPIFWRGTPTDCRSCCRGGNATRIEPSWATRLWLWELSIWPRYCTVSQLWHSFQSFCFMFHCQPLNFSWETCNFALTVIGMAISVCVPSLACQRAREREPHVILNDSCSSHTLLCEIMGHSFVSENSAFSHAMLE